ncbi:MAG TPA: pyridoxamine 5'-phosphate oxidase [Arenibacter sp.]|nr:pyridoxamine 5'-phosphate oxidase [Arenibacter sp.]
MQKDLGDYRKSYEKSELTEATISGDPMALFQKWFVEMEASNTMEEANAMTVSTLGLDGYPKSRIVLLKKYTDEGFTFYTNYGSEKGKAITNDPKVCLSFYWPGMERQVIVKGSAERIAPDLSDAYFRSRPEGSKLGAIVSDQSTVVPNREFLESKLKDLENTYANKEIERPGHWGGFIVKPVSMEFWQGRPNRLHDRIRYSLRSDRDWKMERLAP